MERSSAYIAHLTPSAASAHDELAGRRPGRVRERGPSQFRRGFPALAVEVLSPDDRPGDVLARVADWLNAGCRLIWVIDPQRNLARVYRADGSAAILSEQDELTGEDVVPGFSCSLASIL
jgi:Uma2 family endonuclease